jgi:hypothetical protein
MDSIILSRIAMAGWIFLAIFIGSLWSTHSETWQKLLGFLQDKDRSAFAIAVFGALVGIGAPPALGFLLERVVTLFLITVNRSMTVYPDVKRFKEALAGKVPAGNGAIPESLTGESVFHVYFHTYAHSNLLNWSRRRLAQVYASATGVLAVLSGLVCGMMTTRSFNWGFVVLCLVFAAVLFNDARLQSNTHKGVIEAWIQTADLMKKPSNDIGA